MLLCESDNSSPMRVILAFTAYIDTPMPLPSESLNDYLNIGLTPILNE